jgi:hypothetical protein
MNIRLLSLITLFLYLSLINVLNASNPANNYEKIFVSRKYKGLIIQIPKADFAKMTAVYKSNKRYNDKVGAKILKAEDILLRLEERYIEMANQSKNNLPICLEKAIECYIEKIKTGEENLVIEWRFDIDVKYIDSYEKFYKQKDGAGGAWDPPRQSKRIVVYNAFEKFCGASFQRERKIVYSKNILTSSIIFHELLHLIRWKYHPRCLKTFQDVDDTLEEAIAEDGTWLVFGKPYTLQYYEKILSYPQCNGCDISQNDCTKKNVCSSPCCDDCEDFK